MWELRSKVVATGLDVESGLVGLVFKEQRSKDAVIVSMLGAVIITCCLLLQKTLVSGGFRPILGKGKA